MKKFSKNKATGIIGVNYVESIITQSGSIFRKITEETDIGIDGYIEFVTNEIVTGTLVAVQIKTGSSFLYTNKKKSFFKVKLSINDVSYLANSQIPVALIVYDPLSNLSGWLDVTARLANLAISEGAKSVSFELDPYNFPFNSKTFKNEFFKVFDSYKIEKDVLQLSEWILSDDINQKFDALLTFVSHPKTRLSRLSCHFLMDNIFHKDIDIRRMACDKLSRYLPHPEVSFLPSDDIIKFVINGIGSFNREEIIKLLETATYDEEYIMERGTVGQSIGVIITNTFNYINNILDIIFDKNLPNIVRTTAIHLVVNYNIWEVAQIIEKEFDKHEWKGIYEEICWMAEQSVHSNHNEDEIQYYINENDINENELGHILLNSSLPFLKINETNLEIIYNYTKNSYVRYEAAFAMNRVNNWYLYKKVYNQLHLELE